MIRLLDKQLKSVWTSRFNNLSAHSKMELKAALMDLREDALQRANESWRRHKAPMALYWKCVGVYAGHLARAIKA